MWSVAASGFLSNHYQTSSYHELYACCLMMTSFHSSLDQFSLKICYCVQTEYIYPLDFWGQDSGVARDQIFVAKPSIKQSPVSCASSKSQNCRLSTTIRFARRPHLRSVTRSTLRLTRRIMTRMRSSILLESLKSRAPVGFRTAPGSTRPERARSRLRAPLCQIVTLLILR